MAKSLQLPDSIQVLDQSFSVQFEDLREHKLAGKVDFSYNIISIDPNQSDDNIRNTLFHEQLHAVEHGMGMDLPEEVILRLTNGIIASLKGRKDLVKLIFDV